MADYPKQGEIWWASFFEGGERPALVVSRNELNRGRFILERKLGELETEQLAEVLLAIAWTIDLFDTAQPS